ncbi:MAG: YlxR family protein [Deltaproteobacteria bacterium]|nr:YlxR family protein [Deltaproteobacteria bacterium]
MGKGSDHVPVRTCICCGAKRSKVALLRLVLDDEGYVVKDEPMERPGRGAYVCRSESCLKSLPKGRLERAFRVRKALMRQLPVSSERDG